MLGGTTPGNAPDVQYTVTVDPVQSQSIVKDTDVDPYVITIPGLLAGTPYGVTLKTTAGDEESDTVEADFYTCEMLS